MIKTLSLYFVLFSLIACSSVPKNNSSGPRENQLNKAYSTLYELCSKQKDLDKISFVKSVSPDLNSFLKDISKVSEKIAKTIDTWSKQDPKIQHKLDAMPPFEAQIRKNIEFETTKQIFTSSGKSLEKLLLLKQNEALSYQSALCRWMSQNEKDKLRQETLQDFTKRLSKLNQRAFDSL